MSSLRSSVVSSVALLALAASGCGGVGAAKRAESIAVHRVAAGDVQPRSVVLWATIDGPGVVQFELAQNPQFDPPVNKTAAQVSDPRVPAKVRHQGLTPQTRYWYRVLAASGVPITGTFVTPAEPGEKKGLRFCVEGDWRGDLAPYPAIRNAAGMSFDFSVELGDTIYADFSSPAVPVDQCRTIEEFRDKHREVYTERDGLNALGQLRDSTATYAMLDDHEVIDDFAGGADPATDPRFQPTTASYINDTELFETGVQAFVEYEPIEDERYGVSLGDPRVAGENKFYRQRQFGDDAVMLLLDARSFRDPELENPDVMDQASLDAFLAASFEPGRTMISEPQLADLEADLLAAEAAGVTWKFVMIPEPIQNLVAGNPRDRYEGYAYERSQVLAFVKDEGLHNVVFVAADIHGMIVNNLEFQRTGPNDPEESVDAFEITVPAVAYYPPLGPDAVNSVSLTPIEMAIYEAMSMDEKDAFFQDRLDSFLVDHGHDPVGLDGSSIQASLIEGRWLRVNCYGWSSFEIDPVSQVLTVTTWGIDYYTPEDASAASGRVPFVLSRFVVTPKPMP
jgi:phosphodiesterase/alkaline phosphatase D-like protein